MYLLASKAVSASSIFFLTLLIGLMHLKLAKNNVRFLQLCDAVASGILLSTPLLHPLPEAAEKFSTIYASDYPLLPRLVFLSPLILYMLPQLPLAIY